VLTATVPRAADPYFAELRRREFSRLDRHGHAYLDYTGAALYAESQLAAHQALLAESVFGNPHSEHGPSRASTDTLERARALVLDLLAADAAEYVVGFTANTSAAVKLVAEGYPFAPGAACVLSADNHNSVNGVREYARRRGAAVHYLPLDDELRLDAPAERLASLAGRGPNLFAFPAQSNFSGVRHPLSLAREARDLGYHVLLDAAAYLPTRALSLRECPADFVALSFYKILGYPTGLGALVARRDALARLERPWFAGGTVAWASVSHAAHRLHPSVDAFEDGTPDFLGVSALEPGVAFLRDVGMQRLGAHVAHLTALLLDGLTALHHADGAPLVRIYGPTGLCDRGGTVAFNVVDRSGVPVAFGAVEARARQAHVSLRGGCFCNPGASEAAFAFDGARSARCLRALGAGFTIDRFRACLGGDAAVGAVRASPGLATNEGDVRRALEVVGSFAE
jgi:selenocysteine lyase/cysteine desulfurase